MDVVFFETAPWERRYLTRALKHTRLSARFVTEPLTDALLAKSRGASILSVFIYSRLTRALIGWLQHQLHVVTAPS